MKRRKREEETIMQSTKLKSIMAIALSSAMLFATAACGTSDKADAGTDSAKGSDAATITSYDVSLRGEG